MRVKLPMQIVSLLKWIFSAPARLWKAYCRLAKEMGTSSQGKCNICGEECSRDARQCTACTLW